MTDFYSNPAVTALAEALASMDGKLERFRFERDSLDSKEAEIGGHYDGYMIEAEEVIVRLRRRGFDIIPLAGSASS